jgi:hypothetical protein
MRIVHQSAPFSPASLSCPFPLLAAPPPHLLLPAPRIDGLLPARVQQPTSHRARIEIVREVPATFEELLAQIGPIRSQEEMDAEMVEFLLAADQRMARRFGQSSSLLAFWNSSERLEGVS